MRVQKSRDFRRIERQGLRGQTALVSALARPVRPERSRVGFTVSKKVGGAVTRNLVKRRLREIVRQDKALFAGLEVVLIAREPAAKASFAALKDAVVEAVRRARAAITEQKKPGRPPRERQHRAEGARGHGARGDAPQPGDVHRGGADDGRTRR